MTDVLNISKIQKLVAVACHKSTIDTEAISALRLAESYSNTYNRSLSDLILGVDTPTYRALISTPIPRYLNQISELQISLNAREKEIRDLKKQQVDELRVLRKELLELKKQIALKKHGHLISQDSVWD